MTKTSITPIGANILVKPLEEETKTVSGIVLPDTVDQQKPFKGEVIALGKGEDTKFNVKVGDVVLFKKFAPDEVEIDGETLLIMTEEAVLGVINKI